MKTKTIYTLLGVGVASGIAVWAYKKYAGKKAPVTNTAPQVPVATVVAAPVARPTPVQTILDTVQKVIPVVTTPVFNQLPPQVTQQPAKTTPFLQNSNGDRPVTSSGITFNNAREQENYYQMKYNSGRAMAGLRY